MSEVLPKDTQRETFAGSGAASSESRPVRDSGLSGTPTSDWQYVAEGGANIVFGYHGSDTQYKGRALRIPKNYNESDLATTWREDLLPRLLPAQDLPGKSAVKLSRQWVQNLVDASAGSRPQERRDADQIDFWPEEVLGSLMEDLRSGPKESGQRILAIEIKPKWGFIPSAEFIHPPEAAAIKSQNSRYRLHQHLRGKASEYEPLDLYSGDKDRMNQAISSLWGLWQESDGHSNSWRVFVDGKSVDVDRVSDIPGSDQKISIVDRTVPIVLPALKRTGVLQRLRTLQSGLDPTDISHIARRFASEYPDSTLFDPSLIPDPTSKELHQVIQLYLSDNNGTQAWTLRELMIAYALSATFKDCSIFVTCPLVPDGDGNGSGWKAIEAETTVKVIDLDLKPIKNMRKWYDLDEKIWRYWYDTHNGNVASSS